MSESNSRWQLSDVESMGDPTLRVRLSELQALLKGHLANPREDSLVAVAGAHMELKRQSMDVANDVRAECLLDVANFFYISGRTVLALEPAANAVQFCRQMAVPELLRKALTIHGVLLADSGNLPEAIECQADALELALSMGNRFAEGVVWNNLGLALLYGAQYAEAIMCFERVLSLHEDEPALSVVRSMALANVALTCLHMEKFDRGLSAVQASVELQANPIAASELLDRTLAESTYSKLLLEVEQVHMARERCRIAKEYASRSRSQRAELAAAIAEGLCEVYDGQMDVGLTRLQNALQQARIMKSALRDALIALIRAFEVSGQPQLALVNLRELLHHTKNTQQEKSLLHHKLHLERLGDVQDSVDDVLHGGGRRLNRERVRAQWALLHRQAIAAELVEEPTGEHMYRVGKLAALLAAEDGCDDDTSFMVEMAARLHDIGKLGIPDAILAKRGAINAHEQQLVRTHTNIGAELLGQSGLAQMSIAVEVARHHHEWHDGSGYPDGIAGGAIPRVAVYAALADTFDVLTHKRPYREPMTPQRALLEMKRQRGTKFDPELTNTFIALVERLLIEQPSLDQFLGDEARENPFIRARQKIAEALKRAAEEDERRAAGSGK